MQVTEIINPCGDGTFEYIAEVTPALSIRCGYIRPCSLSPDVNEMTMLRAFANTFFAAQPIIPQGTPIVFPIQIPGVL